MAIVTISRIQHRRGYLEQLPQLSAAELGWAVDARRLYIGNGPLIEGAPTVGNTEILTEYSDLLSTSQNYTFKNSNTNFTPTTGPSANAPVIRTMQNKFDEFVSVKDFGAKGDGSTDDTDAINRALYELYCREVFVGVQRALYFPAGHYMISDYIKVPPHASLLGEGPSNTLIEQTADPNVVTAVMQTADSLQQFGGGIGADAATLPVDILITGMSLLCNLDGIYIQNCQRITLDRVNIIGQDVFPTSETSSVALDVPTSSKGIYISGTSIEPSEDINIIDVFINKFNFGIWQNNVDEYVQNLVINSTTFEELFQAIFLAVDEGTCRNITVTSSVFDAVYQHAVNLGNVLGFASSFNYYKEIGTRYNGAGSPYLYPIINFGDATSHSASLGDLFDRPDSDSLIETPVAINNTTSFFQYGKQLATGYRITENGNKVTLTDATVLGDTGIHLTQSRCKQAHIAYRIVRGGAVRSGVLNVSLVGSTASIDDDSTETGDVGVTFAVTANGTTGIVQYTTSSAAADAIMFYSVMRLNDVV